MNGADFDGKAVINCTLPEYKQTLETIRSSVEDGMVDPKILPNTNSTMIEKMATGKAGIAYGGWVNYSKPAFVEQLKAVYADTSRNPMSKNIKIEDGESGAAQSASGYDAVFAINADLAQEPEKLDAALEQNAQFIFGSHPMSEYDNFLNFLYGTCNLRAYLDDATAQLTAIGYIK